MLKSHSKKGFTLIEMVVSIAVFGIVAVIMTGIILNMASVSYTVDRRTDFLNVIEMAVNNIKNEMRNAVSMGLCTSATPGAPKALYVTKKPIVKVVGQPAVQESYQLSINQNRIVWQVLSAPPTAGACVVTGNPEFVTPSTMFIQNLSVVTATDTNAVNTLIYTSFEACDAPTITKKIFNCDSTQSNLNPYRYMFAISTRNF